MNSMHGRVILVTGAAGAIGLATVEKAASQGAKVIGLDRDLGRLSEVLPDSDLLKMDTGDVTAWNTLEEEMLRRFGSIDGLVACAGILNPRDGDVDDLDLTVWQDTLRSNLTSVLLASRTAIKLMSSGSGGSIVHIGSTVAHLGSSEPQLAYTASKGGVLALARELAVAHAAQDIRVNLVSPGLIATPMTRHLVEHDRAQRRRLAHIPLQRVGEPDEVAEAILWLLSDASRYVTGTEIIVDGGMTSAFITGNE